MSYSLNEVEATAKKAARGAGYPWGLAEEAARATRWLCAQDVDGCAVLARVLERFDGADLSRACPEAPEGGLRASGGILCPITTGAALSDLAFALTDDGIAIGETAEPLILLPQAAWVAERIGAPVTLSWPGGSAVTDGKSLEISGECEGVIGDILVRPDGSVETPRPIRTRARPDAETWAALNRLAHRTYAPATEASRLKGAGAGLSDND